MTRLHTPGLIPGLTEKVDKNMTHSLSKIWIHLVLRTKYQEPYIDSSNEAKIYDFLKEEMKRNGCYIEKINGVSDHIHILFRLNKQIAVADIVKQIKGSSSFWINDNKLTEDKFAWQTGYGAFSVSEGHLDKIKMYIAKQKEHHAKKTLVKECEE